MSVVIRMKRAGAKKRPFYRVVVADSRFARDGRYIEQLGYYDPLTDPAKFQVDTAKFEQWIRRGAKPSESVEMMMAKHAPAALRPAPAAEVPPAAEPEAAPEAAPEPESRTEKKAKKAAPKGVQKPKPATKGVEKKAKTRAKAKRMKAAGIKKPKASTKVKKTKK